MGRLKSSFELASERIIVSRYATQLANELSKKRKEEAQRTDNLPDFVLDWERQQKEDYDGGDFLSISDRIEEIDIKNNPTRLFTAEELEKIKKKEEIMQKEISQIPAVAPETISYGDSKEVHWYGHFTTYGGFSRMNRAMVFGLSNRGVKVKIDMQNCKVEINEATKAQLDILKEVEISPRAPKVYGATIPISMMHGGKKILYTMMETSETLHKDYVGKMNLFDEIWVPTNHGANLFKTNGVRPPIYVMPLGVDTNRYSDKTEPYNFGDTLNTFRFLSVFKWGYRKGYDILLKSYMEEFSSNDDVSLLILTRSEADNNPNRISNDFQQIRNGIDKKDEQIPHVSIKTKLFSEKDFPKIYRATNAFVLISYGEGFGLPYYEAASCGLPVIGSKCSGHGDLLNDKNSYVVNPDGFEQVKINGNMSGLAKHCGFYENQVFPVFGKDAIMKTREHMRYIYENYQIALKKARILQKEVRDNYSWDMAVQKVLNRIEKI